MKFQEKVSLAKFSSYKIGGPARYFCAPKDLKELIAALREWKGKTFIMGGGTNLLIGESGFDGLVLKPDIRALDASGTIIHAGAGVMISDLLDFASVHGLSGLEWAGGLPGTVGGAIRGNAGAFGGEIKDVVALVESLDTQALEEKKRNCDGCRFQYRSSIFKEKAGEEIITAVMLRLTRGDPMKIKTAIQEKINYRKERHPMEYPNIGSIFKNVDRRLVPKEVVPRIVKVVKTDPFPVVPTAYLISETGLKGVSFGGAMVSPKHPNFIVNVMDAKASDVRALRDLVRAEVKREFDIELEQEVEEI